MTGPIMVDIDGLSLTDDDRQVLAHPLTGGVILFARNYADKEQVRELIKDIHQIKSPSLIVAVDQEGGRVQRFKNEFTSIPPMRVFGDLFDGDELGTEQLCEDVGWLMACELRDVGVDLNFAPVLDLDHGCSDVIGDRAYHRNSDVVVRLASAFIAGYHSGGIATCIKHFPGHGAVIADSHHELPIDKRQYADVAADLSPFRQLMSNPLDAVMTAHLVVTCKDSIPVSFSSQWLQRILREELGFQGVVFSDDLSMKGADRDGGIVEKATMAYAAGCDFLPICNDRPSVETLYAASMDFQMRQFRRLRATRDVPENYAKTSRYKETQRKLIELMKAPADG